MKCPKCNGEMEKGSLIDQMDPMTISKNLVWGQGKGYRLGKVNNEKEVISYRCKKCGYLENYAK